MAEKLSKKRSLAVLKNKEIQKSLLNYGTFKPNLSDAENILTFFSWLLKEENPLFVTKDRSLQKVFFFVPRKETFHKRKILTVASLFCPQTNDAFLLITLNNGISFSLCNYSTKEYVEIEKESEFLFEERVLVSLSWRDFMERGCVKVSIFSNNNIWENYDYHVEIPLCWIEEEKNDKKEYLNRGSIDLFQRKIFEISGKVHTDNGFYFTL